MSFFIKYRKIIPVNAKQQIAIIEYKKYSENTEKVTPEEVIAKINNAGAPKFAE